MRVELLGQPIMFPRENGRIHALADSSIAAGFFHVRLNNQDSRMVRAMPETEPAPLYRPDALIAAWRRLCEEARSES